jgi:hypothetical protein
MCATEPVVWVKVATMHFEGVAARWLQSIEPRLPTWPCMAPILPIYTATIWARAT